MQRAFASLLDDLRAGPMDWVWIVAIVWVALAVPVALLIGRMIFHADVDEARARRARTAMGEGLPPGVLALGRRRRRSHSGWRPGGR